MRLLSWHDVERAAPNERPRVLLELIAARLTAARRLPASGALTVRELTRAPSYPTRRTANGSMSLHSPPNGCVFG